MQQQLEREEEESSDRVVSKKRQQFRYSTPFFWSTRLMMITALGIFLWGVWESYLTKKTPTFTFFSYASLFFSIINFREQRQKERNMLKYGNEIFIVDEDGIEWKKRDKTTYMRWDEITQAYVEEGFFVLIKKGAGEEEIRLWDTSYLRQSPFTYFFPIGAFGCSLPGLIHERCPLLQHTPWEERNKETISPKSPRSAYQTAGAQVFSYHTKSNQITVQGISAGIAMAGFVVTAIIASLLRQAHIGTMTIFCIFILPLVVGAISTYYWKWNWYVKSQVETDDLGVALVEPKGITWRILWFTVESYTTVSKHGILKTKDGKTYQFPLNTARKDELEAEIRRRIGAE
jgi:hypothetical protein